MGRFEVCVGEYLGFGLWALGFGLWALGFGLWALGFGLLSRMKLRLLCSNQELKIKIQDSKVVPSRGFRGEITNLQSKCRLTFPGPGLGNLQHLFSPKDKRPKPKD
jgi:hypothetical protein